MDFEELAKRLFVATVSYQMGNKSMDHFRKQYVREDEPIGRYWVQLAKIALLSEQELTDHESTSTQH